VIGTVYVPPGRLKDLPSSVTARFDAAPKRTQNVVPLNDFLSPASSVPSNSDGPLRVSCRTEIQVSRSARRLNSMLAAALVVDALIVVVAAVVGAFTVLMLGTVSTVVTVF
jgi:hypothetical protein